MASSRTSETTLDFGFVCDCGDWARSACSEEPFFQEHEGKKYCVLHFPSDNKTAAFEEAFQRKTNKQDFNFRRVWFPENAEFMEFEFTAEADFTYAIFNASAEFYKAIFRRGAYFNGAVFKQGSNFCQAIFDAGANFQEAVFLDDMEFSFAEFNGEVSFERTIFDGVAAFFEATFKDHVRFAGHENARLFSDSSSLNLQFVRIEEPEHFSFHTVTASPSWFVDVDARHFEFTDVRWNWRSIEQEVTSIRATGAASPYSVLETAYRRLAVNAEENHYYADASEFRYRAMNTKRVKHWRGFDFRRLSWWYWLASGYGERIARAAVVLLGILVLCAALYTRVGFVRWEPKVSNGNEAATAQQDETGAPLKLTRALTYSAAVMTFQRPEPRPATTAAQTIVLFETILGPVQAALLALAIRRKFMR